MKMSFFPSLDLRVLVLVLVLADVLVLAVSYKLIRNLIQCDIYLYDCGLRC
jgi:hypothetical protein